MASNYPIGITRTLGASTWKMQDNYVERIMDNAAYTAAHPDDTLVLAGPARQPTTVNTGSSGSPEARLLAIGHLQGAQFSQSKPTQPMMAIGSGRSFFVSGKAQGQCNLSRLFVNGRNLLRVLYHNARRGSLKVGQMDDKAALKSSSQYYVNLDSELYLVPFGLAVMFRDKVHDLLGSFYVELSMITSYAIGVSAGQNMIMEQTSVVFDRMRPFLETSIYSYAPDKTTVDKVIGFTDTTVSDAEAAEGASLQAHVASVDAGSA